MDALEIGGAPDELSLVPAGLFKKHGQHTTDASFIELALLSRQQKLQGGEPLGLDRFGDLAGSRCCGGAGPRRILERERLSKADLFDKIERGLEVLVALLRIADDQIGRKSEIGTGRA